MRQRTTSQWQTSFRGLLLILLCSLVYPSVGWSITAANTLLRNQASATFKDESGTRYNVTSNVVETLVQQVAGLDLTQSQTKLASIDGSVEFTHVVTNTGNGDDKYALTSTQLSTDQFDFSQVTFYADANQDGQADDLSKPITVTPLLSMGESFAFVAIAKVPNTALSTNVAEIKVTASSNFKPTQSADNTDTAKVTDKAIIQVTKAISANKGKAGSGNYTVTLHYRNTSNVAATQVTLLDALPTGMDYVANSARWSATGSSVILTDTNPNDSHGSPSNIRYCAYDISCVGLAEANRDTDSDSTNQVTAILSEVGAGVNGDLSFEVKISSNIAASILSNIAEYEFHDGTSTTPRENTNVVHFEVIQTPNVVTNGSSTSNVDLTSEPIVAIEGLEAKQNTDISFKDYVWNTGNGADSFDITLDASTFPNNTVFQLFQADGKTPLLDTNGNGIPDTGTQPAGSVTLVTLRASLPPTAKGDNSGNGYNVLLVATSFEDNTKSNSALNKLDNILSNSVDLTNDAALGQTGATGVGVGPESTAVTTRNAMPGSMTRFILYVNNTSTVTDNFDLAASTDSSFTKLELPAGWTLKFVDDAGRVITNTGSIAAGQSKRVFAEITLAKQASSMLKSIYFRALSTVTGTVDYKHDALAVGAVTDLVLFPDNTGQVLPSGVVIYSHWLVNQGNTLISNINLDVLNDQAGWQAQIYQDTDNDGVLSGDDIQVSSLASLAVAEGQLLFVKVFAPAEIPLGTANISTVKATWHAGADSTFALDVSTTNSSDVTIRKEQALDATCNGVPDFAYSYADFDASPKQCVLYRLTATNTGTQDALNVKIQDASPAFTSFITVGGLIPALSQGNLAAPISYGASGTIIGEMGTVPAGAQATLTFGVKID